VVKLRARRTQTRFDIAQGFSVRQLRECHAQELIPAGKTLELMVAVVTIDASAEFRRRKEVHQLRENRFARVQVLPPAAKSRQNAAASKANSNRFSTLDG